MLNAMPKPAIHHLHLTAACPMRHLVKLTYNDIVYFNKDQKMLKVFKNQPVEEGFLRCTDLRKDSSSPEDFDKLIEDHILLGPEQIACQETGAIW